MVVEFLAQIFEQTFEKTRKQYTENFRNTMKRIHIQNTFGRKITTEKPQKYGVIRLGYGNRTGKGRRPRTEGKK